MKQQFKLTYNNKTNLFRLSIKGVPYTMSLIELAYLKNFIADRIYKYQKYVVNPINKKDKRVII